jgi:hypothetical protein
MSPLHTAVRAPAGAVAEAKASQRLLTAMALPYPAFHYLVPLHTGACPLHLPMPHHLIRAVNLKKRRNEVAQRRAKALDLTIAVAAVAVAVAGRVAMIVKALPNQPSDPVLVPTPLGRLVILCWFLCH